MYYSKRRLSFTYEAKVDGVVLRVYNNKTWIGNCKIITGANCSLHCPVGSFGILHLLSGVFEKITVHRIDEIIETLIKENFTKHECVGYSQK